MKQNFQAHEMHIFMPTRTYISKKIKRAMASYHPPTPTIHTYALVVHACMLVCIFQPRCVCVLVYMYISKRKFGGSWPPNHTARTINMYVCQCVFVCLYMCLFSIFSGLSCVSGSQKE